MDIVGIIPARYDSTRFPGKPLVDIQGKTMIHRVYEQATQARLLNHVVVATDDQRIFDHVTSFNGQVIMTGRHHKNGTERCREVLDLLEKEGQLFDVAINIQGDEPFIDPEQIDKVAACFATDASTQIATLIKLLENEKDLLNPSIIKVVKNSYNNALYFSRSPIPFYRDGSLAQGLAQQLFYKHIGIYAYQTNVLKQLTQLSPSILECTESLEQLRWLENGFTIHVEVTNHESRSVDTPEDLLTIN